METLTLLAIAVVVMALLFDFVNGWNDSANAIATVVGTRVLSPLSAVTLAAIFNLAGALIGTKVAHTIAKIVHFDPITIAQRETALIIVIAGLLSAAVWAGWMTVLGMPISGSHSLIGGIMGSAVAAAGVDILDGNVVGKILLAMIFAPVLGFCVAYIFYGLLIWLTVWMRPSSMNRIFGKLQVFSASWMAFVHGTNDAQKVMGIITFALIAGNFQWSPPASDARYKSFFPAEVAEFSLVKPGQNDGPPDGTITESGYQSSYQTDEETISVSISVFPVPATEKDDRLATVKNELQSIDPQWQPGDPAELPDVTSWTYRSESQQKYGVLLWKDDLLFRIQTQDEGALVDFSLVYFNQISRFYVLLWVKLACAFVISLGTAVGGWKVIKTLGHQLTKMHPTEGFAAETSASLVLSLAATLGVPTSTTHTITGSILGLSATKGRSHVSWGLGEKIMLAWVFTLPSTAAMAGGLFWLIHVIFSAS